MGFPRFLPKSRWIWIWGLILAPFFIGLILYFQLPSFDKGPYSTLLLSRENQILAAKVASDGQWRLRPTEPLPEKFIRCLVTFEDKHFYAHPGVDVLALGRAFYSNIKKRTIVSGGSTLTMQVLRLGHGHSKRNFWNKTIEIFQSLLLERFKSKKEILETYAALAPFGRNTVGLAAASWRYYGKSLKNLSWAECAVLAILPNNPSHIYPGKGHTQLKKKRDRLLNTLFNLKYIDKTTLESSLAEPLPSAPVPLPENYGHLLDESIKQGMEGRTVESHVSFILQERVLAMAKQHMVKLSGNGIENAAVLIIDNQKQHVLAYLGNVTPSPSPIFSPHVDLIQAKRSTGSLLKPFLYALALQEGQYLPQTIVPDIPTLIGSYYPKNHDLTYDGAVPFSQSLARSLNVPSVRVLQQYGHEKFVYQLQKLSFSSINKPASHYGLSVILGGAESTLWELCRVYSGLAKHETLDGRSFPVFSLQTSENSHAADTVGIRMEPWAIYEMLEAMAQVNRPDEEWGWKEFPGQKIAWKTGTSFGNRDAWSIGITPEYTVGIWIGNADGEGRPQLTGIGTAAPLLFDVFKLLRKTNRWFPAPVFRKQKINVCIPSGMKANPACAQTKELWVAEASASSPLCSYCKNLWVDAKEQWQLSAACAPLADRHVHSYFMLPPVMEHYYKKSHTDYVSAPKFKENCIEKQPSGADIDIIYPNQGSKIYLPKEGPQDKGQLVIQVASRFPKERLFWYMDQDFIGETKDSHSKSLWLTKGTHTLSINSAQGSSQQVTFEILSK